MRMFAFKKGILHTILLTEIKTGFPGFRLHRKR